MLYKLFTFNPFAENTYVLYDTSKSCIIIDPGCLEPEEEQRLFDFIENNELIPQLVVNTHAHLDHVFGNAAVLRKYKIPLAIHAIDVPLLRMAPQIALSYGLPTFEPSPEPDMLLADGDVLKFGETELEVLFTPGHCPGEVCLYHKATKTLIAGDVLFSGSIGRTDLPGGDMNTLAESIRTKIYTLPDEVTVLPGHGPATSVGYEKISNPFVRA